MADYFINTISYVKNCENKAKPLMHCNGKCQMMKKLAQQENNDKQNPERRQENKNEITLFSKSFFTTISFTENKLSAIKYPCFGCSKETKMPHSVFHPPTV